MTTRDERSREDSSEASTATTATDVDDARARGETEARRRRQREHRKRNRARNKLAMRREVEGLARAFLARAGTETATKTKAEAVDWTRVPSEAGPLDKNAKGGEARGLRKRNQVATFATHLRSLVASGRDVRTVVDFGCGTGSVVMACAALFPQLKFVGIDLNPVSIDILNRRIAESGMTNVSARVGLIEESETTLDDADVALALHVCGEATDFVMDQAIERRIPFIIAPCCVGKVQKGGMRSLNRMRNDLISIEKPNSIERPRSRLMRAAGFDFESYMNAAALADWSGHQGVDPTDANEPLARLPRLAKTAIETDRGAFARENNYEVSMFKMPAQSGIRDDVIVGVPHHS